MSEQPEVMRLLKHMDDEWPEDWDQKAIKNELCRLHSVNADLLEALNHIAETYCEGWCKESGGSFDDCGGCKARAAIAKATGEQL